ncbi:MAG: helix-turn-helix domain-containing protein [Actinomycetota bacterium]|nr:helix-turn-helix domain-containing protein [Actinomycetota bacterium]
MRRAADVSPLVPRFVTRYTDAPGIPVGCVRWCHARGCRTLVVAVDAVPAAQDRRGRLDLALPELHARRRPAVPLPLPLAGDRVSAVVRALLAELDEQALDQLAELLAPRLAERIAPATTSPWLDVDEAAAYLRCSRQRIYDLRHAGDLTPHRDGRRLLFRRDDLDAYLNGRST